MAQHDNLTSLFTAIANAIRAKTGGSGQIVADNFPDAISQIETGTQLPTLTNPGTAADMAQGKQLIDQDGEIVTGTVNETVLYNPGIANVVENDDDYYSVKVIGKVMDNPVLLRVGANVETLVPGDWFGNATAADVAAGKTFTSAAGVNVAGTAASMPAMATVTVNIGSTSWTNTDIFAPFDYLSIGSLPFDPSAARVSSPATFQVPVGGAFGIAAGAGGVKPISITGGRIIIDSEGTDGCHYSMIVVESASCYITMGLT